MTEAECSSPHNLSGLSAWTFSCGLDSTEATGSSPPQFCRGDQTGGRMGRPRATQRGLVPGPNGQVWPHVSCLRDGQLHESRTEQRRCRGAAVQVRRHQPKELQQCPDINQKNCSNARPAARATGGRHARHGRRGWEDWRPPSRSRRGVQRCWRGRRSKNGLQGPAESCSYLARVQLYVSLAPLVLVGLARPLPNKSLILILLVLVIVLTYLSGSLRSRLGSLRSTEEQTWLHRLAKVQRKHAWLKRGH